jgi:TPR repeat protein
MSRIDFHTEIGAPRRYEAVYVSISPEEGDEPPVFEPETAAGTTEALAREGSATAQFALGHILLSGQGMPRDHAAAYRWFRGAARAGDAAARQMGGRGHECGWGVPPHSAEAARWDSMAVEKSHPWAMFNLGMLMLAGGGCAPDLQGAKRLFVRASRLGNAKAMTMLGHLREEGWGVPRKPYAALCWFRRAAIRGCFRAQYSVARYFVRQGRIEDAARLLETAFASAPRGFCREAGTMLLKHPDERLRSVARAALSRLEGASQQPGPGHS